jgi:hypothetical protein
MKNLRSLLSIFLLFCVCAPAVLTSTASAADLSITTTSFLPGARAKTAIGTAGAAITIGQLLYFDSATDSWKLADADASATTALVVAIAGSAAAIGQPVIVILEDDDLTLGATLSMTAPVYVLSATAGGIAPSADITTGWYPCAVLVAKSTSKCIFKPAALRGTAAAS